MSERRDDTTEPDERDAPPEPERAPRNYYYDDGTGYEVYDPAEDEDEPAEGDGDEDGSDETTHAAEIATAGYERAGTERACVRAFVSHPSLKSVM